MPQRLLFPARHLAYPRVHVAFDLAPIIAVLQHSFAAKIVEDIEVSAPLVQAETLPFNIGE